MDDGSLLRALVAAATYALLGLLMIATIVYRTLTLDLSH